MISCFLLFLIKLNPYYPTAWNDLNALWICLSNFFHQSLSLSCYKVSSFSAVLSNCKRLNLCVYIFVERGDKTLNADSKVWFINSELPKKYNKRGRASGSFFCATSRVHASVCVGRDILHLFCSLWHNQMRYFTFNYLYFRWSTYELILLRKRALN